MDYRKRKGRGGGKGREGKGRERKGREGKEKEKKRKEKETGLVAQVVGAPCS